MILFVVCSIVTGFAQSPSDFELKVNVTNGSCLRDGIIEIQVHKKAGTPNYKYVLGYNLKNSDGFDIFTTEESTPNNIFGNLAPGVYKPIVFVYIKDSASNETLQTIKIEGANTGLTTTYKQPTLVVNLVRKPLPFYKENGVHNPATGIITISIHDGNGPYTINLKKAPEGYKCEQERTFDQNGTLTYYGVIPGDYIFSARDRCGNLGDRPIHVDYIEDPYPQKESEFPIGVYARQSEDMRLSHCGWMYKELVNRFERDFSMNKDIFMYISPLDTLAKYYEYANSTQAQDNRGEVKKFLPFFTTQPWDESNGSWSEVFEDKRSGRLYMKLENGLTYFNAINNANTPRTFFRVKGADDSGSKTFMRSWVELVHSAIKDFDNYFENPCDKDYYFRASAPTDMRNLVCLPMRVDIFEGGNAAPDLLYDSFDITHSATSNDRWFQSNKKLKMNTLYTIRFTGANGDTYTMQQNLTRDYTFSSGMTVVKDFCGLDRFSMWFWIKNDSKKMMSDFYITLIEAPKGYKPEEFAKEWWRSDPGAKPMSVGVPYRYTKEQIDKSRPNYVFPTYFPRHVLENARKPQAYIPYTNETAGDYVFELRTDCGEVYKYTIHVPEPDKPAVYQFLPENFRPVIEKSECGRVRIYPFKNLGPVFTKNGVPQTSFYLKYDALPSGINSSDIKTNVPSQFISSHSIFYHNAENIKPDDVYIDVPERESTYKFKIFPQNSEWYFDQRCYPVVSVKVNNLPLSFNPDSYSSYSCFDRRNGHIYIEPINNVGSVTMELYTAKGGTLLETKNDVTGIEDFNLGLYIDKMGGRIGDNFFMIIKDNKCKNTSEENLVVYNLGSDHLIGTTPDRMNFCEGQSVSLICPSFGRNMNYTWLLPNGKQLSGRTIRLENLTNAYSGRFSVVVYGKTDCKLDNIAYSHFFDVSVAPDELWWNKPVDANWNNPKNWYDKDGNPSNAIPARCTNVHIPAHPGSKNDSGKDIFPDLNPMVSIRGDFSLPECNDIYFHYGSKLGDPQNLTYHHAYVDYNFGIVDESSNEVSYKEENLHYPEANGVFMNRNQWYMLSAPLQNMYAADFSMAGYPMTYNRYVKSSTKSDVPDDVSFSASVPTLSSKYSYTQYDHGKAINALAMKVDGYKSSGVYSAGNQKNLNTIHGIFRIPYFEDANRMRAYPLESYNEASGESQVFYFNKETLKVMNKSERISRTEDAYRFVFESELENGVKGVGTIIVNGSSMQGYSVSTDKIHSGEWFMLGNPFMSPIDFDKFYEINKDYIESYYYIYEDGRWKVYSQDNKIASTLGSVIEPMQSILLRKKGGNMLAFPTFGSKSVLVSPNKVQERSLSSRAVEAGSLYPLHITAKNKAGETTAMLGIGTRSGNLPALSNDANTDIPVAYIVDPENGEANVFQNCEDSDAEGFTLGVYTKLNAPVDLYVDNIDRSRFKMLLMEDRLTGKVQDLLQNPLYSFVNEPGYSGRRFYLRINHASPYSDHRGNINISVDSDKVGIQSQSPISRAMIFDMTGKLVVMQDGDSHTLTMNLPLNSSGEYIVKVQLADGTGTIKKLLKSF